MVVEGIHYHQQNLCFLHYKDIKDTGLASQELSQQSWGENTTHTQKDPIKPSIHSKLGAADIKMKITHLLRGLQFDGRVRLSNN